MALNENKIEDFAEELGKLLGSARSKAEGWLGQRQQITKALQGIRDEATSLLSQLGHQAEAIVRRRGRAASNNAGAARRGPGRPKGSGVRKRRKMSAAARAKISAAQKARWAKQKAGERKSGMATSMPRLKS
jgi:hypothetical protein